MPIDPEKFTQSLTYAATAVPDVVEADLKRIGEIDREAEARQRAITRRAGFSCGAVVLFFILTVVTAAALPAFAGVLGIAVIVTLVYMIFLIVRSNRIGRLNISSCRYRMELLAKLAGMFQQDMKPDAPLDVRLVVSKPVDKSKFVGKSAHPLRKGWTVETYDDEWLTVKGRFLDGTRFSLVALETVEVRSGRNSNGKFKSKQKAKGFETKLELVCPQERYEALPGLGANAARAVQVPQSVVVKRLEVTPRGIELQEKVPASPSPGDLLYRTVCLMLLSSYQILNRARTPSPGRTSR